MTSPTIMPLFTTPMATERWEDCAALNGELLSYIDRLRAAEDNLGRSTVNGWHSRVSLLDDAEPAIQTLGERLRRFAAGILQNFATGAFDATAMRLEGWANVLDGGGYNSPHSHPNAEWSGVYYVTGNPRNGDGTGFDGKLELFDPRPGAALHYREGSNLYGRFLLDPHPGQVVLFPGWVQHQVHPYRGTEPRVSIAFNVLMT